MRPVSAVPVVVLALLAGCAPPPPPAPPAPAVAACQGVRGEPGITARLYFGRALKGGGTVGDAAWRRFLAEKVTPRFPSGFTVLEGYGQWQQRSTGRIIQEPSTVIEVAAPREDGVIWKLEEIRAEYRQQFAQESVGLVVTENCFSF